MSPPPTPAGVPGRGSAQLAQADPILFDLDGTLTASGPGIIAAVRHALGHLGEPMPPEDALARFIGPPLMDSFMTQCGMDHDRAWQAVLAYRGYYEERGQFQNAVYEGIPEVLEGLRTAGRRLVVATSKAEPYALSILAHFGLLEVFDEVVGSELDGRRTAKAEVIAEALRRVPAASPAVMVGDRSHDVLGARTAGIPSVGVLWGYGSAAELRAAGADELASTPRDLLGLLLP